MLTSVTFTLIGQQDTTWDAQANLDKWSLISYTSYYTCYSFTAALRKIYKKYTWIVV